jgi:catechol 2,3-dioxygenase-like lactoylglutathione lyase family enzyme
MLKTCGWARWMVLIGTLAIGSQVSVPAEVASAGPKKDSVRVVQRQLVGRYIEDLDFVSSGSLAGHIVMLNGYLVHGIPANASSDSAVRTLFDLRQQILGAPRGIAYVASERLFALVDAAQPTSLFLVDRRGTPSPPRPIQYLDGFLPDHMEGLAYVPATSPRFPDHLLTVTWQFLDDAPFLRCRIQVIRRDGQVAAEVPVPDDISINFVLGVAFLAPDLIIVTDGANTIWTLDFGGNIVAGPASTELTIADGIVQLADGRIVTGEGARLRFYDAALNRLPQDDRDAGTRTGLVVPFSVAWNTDTNQHLVVAATEESGGDPASNGVAAVPLSLNASSLVVDLGAFPTSIRLPKATYLPDEHLVAVALTRFGSTPAQIALHDNDGVLVELINASAIGGIGRPLDIAYIAPTREFVVVEQTQRGRLKVLTRSGTLAREIDLAPAGLAGVDALTYFNPLHPSGGQFLIIGRGDGAYRAVVTDFQGNAIREFNPREKLGLSFVTGLCAVTTGPKAGLFTAIESAASPEMVVFRLD